MRINYRHIISVLIMLLAFTPVAYAMDKSELLESPIDTLSLSTAILFALEENPDLQIVSERVEQLGYFKEEAKADYWPRVALNAEGGRKYLYPGTGQNSNNTGKTSLQVNQKLFDGFATSSEVDRREELKNSMELSLEKQEELILVETITNYLEILRLQESLVRTETFIERIDGITAIVIDIFNAGAMSKAMKDYALSRQASAYTSLSEVKSSLNDSISNLEFLTGPLPPFKAVIPDTLKADQYEIGLYMDFANENNTDVQKNEADIRAMEQQLEVEKGAYYPQVDFRFSAEQTHNDGGEVGVGRDVKASVNLSYDIFDGFNKKNRTQRVASQIKELEYKDNKIVKQLKKDIKLAYNQIVATQQSLKAVEIEIASNEAVQALNKENFKSGTINVIELIEGEERLKDAYLKKYQLKQDYYLNVYALLINTSILNDQYFCETCNEDI